MKLKKKTKVILFLLSIVAITIISAILAYLTDKATRDNQFTIGSIEIDLVEESWENLAPEEDLNENGIPDVAEALGPNQTVAKDPKVQNIGDNDAYVYLRVVVPKREVGVAGGELEMQELFSYEIDDEHWVPMDSLTIDGEDYVTYTYYYKKADGDYILKSGAETETLFDEVTLANITDFNGLDLTQQIIVKAYAIQTDENIDVENNKWIAEFTNEKNGIPNGRVMARVANEPEDSDEGFQPGEDVIVETEVNGELFGGENQEPIDETNAPILTGQFGDGEPREGVLDTTPVASMKNGELVAISSRASGGKKVTKLKYKFEVKDGDIGQFKIISFTGNLYNKTGTEVAVETPILKKEEMAKVVLKELAMESLYSQITPANYGQDVNYEITSNEVKIDEWKIFCKEDDVVTIIAKDVIPYSAIPSGAEMTKGTEDESQTCLYRAYWTKKSDSSSLKSRNKLLGAYKSENEDIWKDFVRNDIKGKAIASGGVTATTFVNSWNSYPGQTQTIYIGGNESSGIGLKIGKNPSSSDSIWSSDVSAKNKANDLYYPRKAGFQDGTKKGILGDNGFSEDGKCCGYWLASPIGSYGTNIRYVNYAGDIASVYYYSGYVAVRPSVRLTSDIKGKYKNGKWIIK